MKKPTNNNSKRIIFKGPFDKFQKIDNKAFGSDLWLEHCKSVFNKWKSVRDPYPFTFNSFKRFIKKYILKLDYCPDHLRQLTYILNKQLSSGSTISVIDVGGGFGDNFYSMLTALDDISKLQYFIVDDLKQAKFGKKILDDYPVYFFNDIDCSKKYFMCNLVSTLQYVEDWRGLLNIITNVTEKYIYICRTPLQNTKKQFCLLQNISFAPDYIDMGNENLWVLNENEIISHLHNKGWVLKSKKNVSDYSDNFWNLPGNYRDAYYAELLFIKE